MAEPVVTILISDSDESSADSELLEMLVRQVQAQSKKKVVEPPQNEEVEVLTLSSLSPKSTERCPVTWNQSAKKSSLDFINADTLFTPSPRSKVSDWLKGYDMSNQQPVEAASAAREAAIVDLMSRCGRQPDATEKKSILIRQDYKKPSNPSLVSPRILPDGLSEAVDNTPNGSSTSTLAENNPCSGGSEMVLLNNDEYIIIPAHHTTDRSQVQSTKRFSTSSPQNQQSVGAVVRVPTPVSVRNLNNLVDSMTSLCNSQSSQTSASDSSSSKTAESSPKARVPMSPEAQKKIELCEYLKLRNMHPSDKKAERLNQNRRSSRVKHLALVSEKRQVEQKLKSKRRRAEKKKSARVSDRDSRHSSDNVSKESSKGSTSTPTLRSAEPARTPGRKPHLDKEPTTPTTSKPAERRTSSAKTPAKSLQVPEVSTTSAPKFQPATPGRKVPNHDRRKSSETTPNRLDRDRSSDDDQNITGKSFAELCMDIKSFKPLKNMPVELELGFSLVESISNFPNVPCDFDLCVLDFVSPRRFGLHSLRCKVPSLEKFVENKKIGKSDLARLEKSIGINKNKSNGNENQKKPRGDNASKLNGLGKKVLTRTRVKAAGKSGFSTDTSENHKRYPKQKHLKRLRSRRLLKQVGMKTILRKQRKKKKMQLSFDTKDNYKSTELIQHANSDGDQVVENQQADVVPVLRVRSPHTSMLKADLDLLDNLTPEHIKALFDSKKFVKNSPMKDAPAADVTNGPTNETEAEKDSNLQCDVAVDVASGGTNEGVAVAACSSAQSNSRVSPVAHTDALEQNSPCTEDLEVDRLMNCKEVKKKTVLDDDKESPSVTRSTLKTNSTDLGLRETDHSRCSSCSKPPSSNSESLQTVPTNPQPTPSTSRQTTTIETACENSNFNLPTDRLVQVPSSAHESSSSRSNSAPPDFAQPEELDIVPLTCGYVKLPTGTGEKSLTQVLTPMKRRRKTSRESSPTTKLNWQEIFAVERLSKKSRRSHTVYVSNNNGAILNAYYLDRNLIVVQDLAVSFWNQTPLGNVLVAQNMWIAKGSIRRMVLGNGCVHKESAGMVISSDSSVAYIELWTKEHKSDKRERPVADVFVAIYLRLSQEGPAKRVLQLENIHGYAIDVQYIVLRNSRSIIVCWNVIDGTTSSTVIHCYHLSEDFQTVTSIEEMQTVGHYVSSLNNVEDCDTLILGCGEHKVTLWGTEYGYVVATIDLMEIQPQPRTLWAMCDSGFLFTMHHVSNGVLHLVAINSFDSSWKRLQTYKPEPEHKNLLGVCMEKGILVAFYDTGVLCWAVETGKLILEEPCEDCVFLPFEKHVVLVNNNQVHVRPALEYIINIEDS